MTNATISPTRRARTRLRCAAVALASAGLTLGAPAVLLSQEGPLPPVAAPGADQPSAGAGHTRVGKISGTVTDSAKRALAGFLVTLESRNDPGMLRITSTDVKGQYQFKDLPPGPYDVHVEAEGFRPGRKDRIEVRPPFQNIVDVALLRADQPLPGPGEALRKALGNGASQAAAPGGPATPGTAGGSAPMPPVVVRGTFADAAGRPVVEVSVLLVSDDGLQLYQTFSGDDGAFVIEGVTPGRYRALVRSTGHMLIDLRSVDVHPVSGLNLSLALVDFPLNTQPHGSPPQEVPRPLPAPPPATPVAPPSPEAAASAPS